MSNEPNTNQGSLVKSTNQGLMIKSSSLVKRGLEQILAQKTSIVRFPTNMSLGTLWGRDVRLNLRREHGWKKVGEAMGDVIIPLFINLKLYSRITLPLKNLNPDDLYALEFSFYITNEDLINIQGLTGLKRLRIKYESPRYMNPLNRIDERGLNFILRLTQLESLNLLNVRCVSDKELAVLCNLPKLIELSLGGTAITDTGLAYLSKLTNLQSLSIPGLNITDKGMDYIGTLHSLEILDISEIKLTRLKYLQGLKNLKELWLGHTGISDDGIKYLSGLTNLEMLHLEDTGISDDGVKKLQQALPNCEIDK